MVGKKNKGKIVKELLCDTQQTWSSFGFDVVVVVEAWCLELTRRLPKNSAWLLDLKGIIALPTARNSNEVSRAR